VFDRKVFLAKMIRGDDNYVPVAKFPKAKKTEVQRAPHLSNAAYDRKPPPPPSRKRPSIKGGYDKVDQFHHAGRRQSLPDSGVPGSLAPPSGDVGHKGDTEKWAKKIVGTGICPARDDEHAATQSQKTSPNLEFSDARKANHSRAAENGTL